MLLKPFFCHLFQIGICLPDASARLVDMTDCLCIQALFYRRKQFIPKPVAAVFTLLVRRVLDPVLSLLQKQDVMHMDQIAAELEVSMEELTTTLTELELYGKLERLPGKQFRCMR